MNKEKYKECLLKSLSCEKERNMWVPSEVPYDDINNMIDDLIYIIRFYLTDEDFSATETLSWSDTYNYLINKGYPTGFKRLWLQYLKEHNAHI